MKFFDFFKYSEKNLGSYSIIEENYTRKELLGKFIMRCAILHKFIVFESQQEFWDYKDKEKHALNEIILGEHPQRLKFDIDSGETDIQIKKVTKTIKKIFEKEYFEKLKNKDIYVLSSSSDKKYSYHIIINKSVQNSYESKMFAYKVFYELGSPKYIDMGVYKKFQNFRIIGSVKSYKDRRKFVLLDDSHDFHNTLINVDIATQKTLYKDVLFIEPIQEFDAIGRSIVEFIKDKIDISSFSFREMKNNLCVFERNSPSFCNVCNRIHDNDNTFMVGVSPLREHRIEENGLLTLFSCFWFCIRKPEIKNNIGNLWLPANEEFIRMDHLQRQLLIPTDEPNFNDYFDNCNCYSDKSLLPFEDVPTLAVRAPMGIGKTKMLKEYIKNLEEEKILIVSFRKTFTSSQIKSISGFVSYEDKKGILNMNEIHRLVVQVESLFRIKKKSLDELDLLILDECESVFEQFGSGLSKNNLSMNWIIFKHAVKNCKKLILMDANLCERSLRMIKILRPNYPIFLHWNKCKLSEGQKYIITSDRNEWYKSLLTSIDDGKKVVIPTNIKKEAKIIFSLLKTKYPDLKIRLYSGETKQSKRKKHFSNIDKYWKVDVLIYTPTVSAGLSFEDEQFDIVHAYFSNLSCNVEISRQMLFRVRNIKDKKYIVLLPEETINLATEIDDLRRLIELDNYILFKKNFSGNDYVPSDLDENPSSPFMSLWLENRRIVNLSKSDFSGRFIMQTRDTGATVSLMDRQVCIGSNVEDEIEICEEKVKIQTATSISEAIEIDESFPDFDGYSDDSPEKIKYLTREIYDYREKITVAFALSYCNLRIIQIFKNLKELYSAIKENPEPMEIIKRKDAIDGNKFNKFDIPFEYDYSKNTQKHIIAYDFLTSFGFTHPFDKKQVELSSIPIVLTNRLRNLQINSLFNISISQNLYSINKVFDSFYGIKIRKKRNKNLYLIKRTFSSVFTFDEEKMIIDIPRIESNVDI